jgi:hypothetical protein
MEKVANYANRVLENLGISMDGRDVRRREPPLPSSLYQADELNSIVSDASQNRVDLQGITSGQIPGLAPIPVPGYPDAQNIPTVPGVNTIPGLSNFNYVVSLWKRFPKP